MFLSFFWSKEYEYFMISIQAKHKVRKQDFMFLHEPRQILTSKINIFDRLRDLNIWQTVTVRSRKKFFASYNFFLQINILKFKLLDALKVLHHIISCIFLIFNNHKMTFFHLTIFY